MAREDAMAPKTAMAAATKTSEQNRRRHESGLNVGFGFVIIELAVRFGLLSPGAACRAVLGRRRTISIFGWFWNQYRSDVLNQSAEPCQHFLGSLFYGTTDYAHDTDDPNEIPENRAPLCPL